MGGAERAEQSDDRPVDVEPCLQRREVLQAVAAGAVAIPAMGQLGEASASTAPAMREIDLMNSDDWESAWDIVSEWDADRWDDDMTLQEDTDRTYEDELSFQIGDGSAAAFVYDGVSATGRVELEFNYWETTSINSGGAALLNENDEVVLLSGTDNAEWKFILDPESDLTSGNSDNSSTAYHFGGDTNYERWRTHRLRVDEDGTFAVQTTDIQTGNTVEHCFEDCLSGYPTETVRSYESIEKVLIWSENDDEFWMENITLSVEQAQGFVVSIEETNEPVESGDTLEVTAEVTNTGDSEETQNVSLEVNGQQQDTASVTLDSADTQELTLDWDATDRNAVGVRVASEDDADNRHVSLTPDPEEVGEATIEIIDSNAPVSEGETLEVDVEITNVGERELTQDVDFDVDGRNEETRAVTVDPGETTAETFTWTVDSRASVGLRAASDDDWDNTHLLLADTDFLTMGL